FRTMLSGTLLNWCRENGYDLYESGLKIYTTLDSRIQQYAEAAVQEKMALLQAAFESQWKARHSEPWVDEGGYEIKDFAEKKIQRTALYQKLLQKYSEHPDSIDIVLKM